MTFLAIFGAVVLTVICILPLRNLVWFYTMSDYGFIDTTKWNWKKEKLWIEWVLLPIAALTWWLLVGTHISISFG